MRKPPSYKHIINKDDLSTVQKKGIVYRLLNRLGVKGIKGVFTDNMNNFVNKTGVPSI